MIEYSAFMEVFACFDFSSTTDYAAGLSPSIHSIDQIKVVDRFRGMAILLLVLSRTLTAYRNTS